MICETRQDVFKFNFEFSGMRLRSLNDKIKRRTLFYKKVVQSTYYHRDLIEEYNGLMLC